MRRLLRLPRTPNGRLALMLLAVAATWTAWSVWPPRPLTRWAWSPEDGDPWVLSPDGSRLLAFKSGSGAEPGASHSSVQLRELTTGRSLLAVEPPAGVWTDRVFAPDASWLATQDGKNAITIWDTTDGHRRLVLPPAGATGPRPRPFVVSSDGRLLACLGHHDWPPLVQIWDLATGRVRATLPNAVEPLAFSPDGRTLVTGFAQGEIDPALGRLADVTPRLWDTADGRERGRLDGPWPHRPGAAAFSPDGRRLAVGLTSWRGGGGGGSTSVTLWNPVTARLLTTIATYGPVLWVPYDRDALRFSLDGRFLVADFGGLERFWDLAADPPRGLDHLLMSVAGRAGFFSGPRLPVFTRRGDRILAPTEFDAGLTVYEAATLTIVGRCPLSLQSWAGPSVAWAVSTDGRLVAGPDPVPPPAWLVWLNTRLNRPRAPDEQRVRLYDLDRGTDAGRIPVNGRALGFDADGRSLWVLNTLSGLFGRPDRLEVQQWAVPTGRPPVWLWAVTALALALAVADRRRSRRRAALAGGAAPAYPAVNGNPPAP